MSTSMTVDGENRERKQVRRVTMRIRTVVLEKGSARRGRRVMAPPGGVDMAIVVRERTSMSHTFKLGYRATDITTGL